MPPALHVTINRKEFLSAFGKVTPVVPSRSPKAILTNVKLVASDDPSVGVTLSGTDLECGIRHRVAGVDVLSPGAAILPTAKVASILSSCRDAELDISIDGDQIVVKSPSATFRLPSENSDLFPEVPGFPDGGYHEVAAADLKKLIKRTIFSTDVESTRYALGGCLVELADDSVTMVATDGRRLAKMTAPAEAVGGATAPEKAPVIPVKALKVILANLDDPELTVHLALQGAAGGTAVMVRTSDGATTVYSRLVEGRFPNYADVFPSNHEVRIPIEAEQLRNVVEQASIVTSDESRGVDFRFAESILTLQSQAADVGSSLITMPIDFDGAAVEITFDPRYLSDALKTIDDGCVVTAELIDHANAAVFKTDDGYSYVVMPLTRTR